MSEHPTFPLKVFYDGSCAVCAREMAVYRRQAHGGRLVFVDISAPGFDPAPYRVTLEQLMREMHAIDSRSRVFRGVAAFRAIWQALPQKRLYTILGTILALPGIELAARAGYWCFARIRRFLPKSSQECPDGVCGMRHRR